MLFFRQHFFLAGQQPSDTRESCSSNRLSTCSALANACGCGYQLGNCSPSFLSSLLDFFPYPLSLDLSLREVQGEVEIHQDVEHTQKGNTKLGIFVIRLVNKCAKWGSV